MLFCRFNDREYMAQPSVTALWLSGKGSEYRIQKGSAPHGDFFSAKRFVQLSIFFHTVSDTSPSRL